MIDSNCVVSNVMVMDATNVIQYQRRFIDNWDEPAVVVLYGDDEYASHVAEKIGITMMGGRLRGAMMSLCDLKAIAGRISQEGHVFHRILKDHAEGHIRVVSIGYGKMVVYDQRVLDIFSMLN